MKSCGIMTEEMSATEDQLAGLSSAKRALLERLRQQANSAAKGSTVIRKRPGGGPAPASFAQQRLWLVHQLDPQSHLFNVPRGIRLRGQLDVPALERSVNEIVRRHEVLRTVFSGDPASLVQHAAELPPITLSPIEISLDDAVQHALAEFSRPFDLETGPVIRGKLWKIADDDHILLLVMHHIVSDAWTAAILFEELEALYGAFSAGRSSPLPELAVQYADYSVWQREFLSGERLKIEISWWAQRLAGAPPVLPLRTDFPRPSIETSEGGLETALIPRPTLDALRQLAIRESATLYITLLAAYSVLLSRWSGIDDIVVGTDFSNRGHTETEKLIGFFINLLPIRTRVPGNSTFRELIAEVKQAALGAYAHPELPFEKLVEELKPERVPSRHPIVQVLLVMQNIPRPKRELAGLEVSEFSIPVITSKFDLAVFLEEKPEGLSGQWVYSAALFKPETIRKMSGRFAKLIDAALADPDARIASLEMRSEEEIREDEEAERKSKQLKSKKLKMTAPAGIDLSSVRSVK